MTMLIRLRGANIDLAWNWTANLTQHVANQLFPAFFRNHKSLGSESKFTAENTGHGSVSHAFQITSTRTAAEIEKAIADSIMISTGGVRSFEIFFNYATSKWALGCIVTAVMLNRANVYARTRQRLNFSWRIRLLLRIIPIILMVVQCQRLLQSIHCQTSNEYVKSRWGNEKMQSDLIFNKSGGFLHDISSMILYKASAKDSCLAVNMIPSEDDLEMKNLSPDLEKLPIEVRGSLSTLWPLFKTISFSHFIETISRAILGYGTTAEYGMSIFELSLAFAEAEDVVVKRSDTRKLGSEKTAANLARTKKTSEKETRRTRSMIIKDENTSPEVLLFGLISALNHLTSHMLAVLGQQSNFRLINTGIWGLAYLVSIMASASSFLIDDEPDQTLPRFPTVCLISFIPHILILSGIIGCTMIYVIALLLTALTPPIVEEAGYNQIASRWQFIQRILQAHHNMQANVSLSRIHVSRRTDIYTASLRTGFAIMSMANEAVYLNESRHVNVTRWTWIEDDRLQEMEESGLSLLRPANQRHEQNKNIIDRSSHEIGMAASKGRNDGTFQSSNGYTREMVAQTSGTATRQRSRISGNGIGAAEQSGRWYTAFELCSSFCWLSLRCYGSFNLWLMARLGIRFKSRWLLWILRIPSNTSEDMKPGINLDINSLNSDLTSLNEKLGLKKQKNLDIEVEFRKMIHKNQKTWTDANEKELEDRLYRWWLDGGWWGENDDSGNFSPAQEEWDDDATSVISTTTADDDQNWQFDSADEDGDRTPTQMSPLVSRESTPPDTTLTISNLAQLLDPKTPEQRAEAESLAVHLSSDKIVTRSRFQELRQRSRAKVLTSTLRRPPNFVPTFPNGRLTPEEESQLLEHLIITRRSLAINSSEKDQSTSWASGMNEAGPLCVICQTSTRCIIIWPCRCLSLCNDCRVTLAMNNFEKCVCCRGDVGSFSRIFVP
ncbi:putative ubiquitin-protein ligase [Golovinomyces cichoracearum]|uniref:Putative ubiquitin-protein ligase n=1 Tax=Golovinomyces cichoracearum TaxID=62708 RepID=A0A420IIH7_9PEZI|nr:putative ubiquitin-protein ligase [Golovinomyces cichoracearum]